MSQRQCGGGGLRAGLEGGAGGRGMGEVRKDREHS